jgi:hypothetical protein
MEERKYKGKKFRVTIRRDTMERRYVLSTLEQNGSFKDQNKPLYQEDFERYYGFSPEWPHEEIKKKKDYLPLDQCKNGFLYVLEARNFSQGIYEQKNKGFIGIRQKFNLEYLFFELHWDVNPQFGTAKPLIEIEQCPISLTNWRDNQKLFDWIKSKN